jgi:hypothetical protein
LQGAAGVDGPHAVLLLLLLLPVMLLGLHVLLYAVPGKANQLQTCCAQPAYTHYVPCRELLV